MVQNYVTVDRTNTQSSIRDNFRKALEDNISDPTNREKRHFIYERDPHTPGTDFEDYPVIYIDDYAVRTDSETQNGYQVLFDCNFDLVLEASEDQAAYFDSISDDLVDTFQGGGDPREELGTRGITQAEINRNNRIVGINVKDKFVFRRELSISFMMHVDMG